MLLASVLARPARRAPRAALALALAALTWLAPTSSDAREIVHVVAKGQTLVRIAKRYNVSVEAIRAVNDLDPREKIHPGLRLVIPERGKEDEAIRKAEERRAKKDAKSKPDKTGRDSKRDKQEDARGGGRAKVDAGAGKGRRGAKDDADDEGSLTRRPKKPGFVRMVRGDEKLETQFLTRHGRLVPSALPGLSRMLRFYPTNAKIPIDPRLATLIGMVSDHFGGRTLHVVSGFRPYSPKQYTPHSNHNVGRAMDFFVEGVPNTTLRDFCRTFRSSGVGYYPNSSFVHLDVRTVKTYWVDYSHPGERPRYDGEAPPEQPDEAASDVDAPPGDGSNDTPQGGAQVPDTSGGNSDASGSHDMPSGEGGSEKPTPSNAPAPSPAAPAGSSPESDPY